MKKLFCKHEWKEEKEEYNAETYDFYGCPCGAAHLCIAVCSKCDKSLRWWKEDGKFGKFLSLLFS